METIETPEQEERQAEERLVRLEEVLRRVGVGKTTLYDWIRTGKFPAHIKLGRSSFWRESSLRTWFDALPDAVSTGGAVK